MYKEENCWSLFLMNINIKFFNKILENWIWQCIKIIVPCHQVGFVLGMKDDQYLKSK